VVAALARHGAVEVAYVPFGADRPAAVFDELEGLRLRALQASRGPGRLLRYLAARLLGVPADFARGVSPELAQAATPAPPGTRIIADGPVAAAALIGRARARQIVYLAHNLESGFRGTPALARFERRVLRLYAESWMATRADVRAAVELGAEPARVRYVPNVVDTCRIAPVDPARSDRVLFVADFTYPPNRQALGWLTAEVLPRLWERRPEARLSLVGRGSDEPQRDARVQALGFVDDLAAAYASADVVAVPLLSGGGSPLKFVEALAYGLPVVATSHAARLLEDGVAGEHFVEAHDAGAFAAALDALLGDPVRGGRIGATGRELVQRSYSVDTLAELLCPPHAGLGLTR
jgi:glycosyltransferase involved in cell wall biosynthesis